MGIPETIRRGRKDSYPWDTLQKKGDYFELPDADQKTARSCRISGKNKGLRISVREMVKGGYVVELVDDRN
ncbi:MAG: hypothetical protein R3232_07065 [Clostridia bacterium]|nr:hypothetical protein [Clostridia bacterium]